MTAAVSIEGRFRNGFDCLVRTTPLGTNLKREKKKIFESGLRTPPVWSGGHLWTVALIISIEEVIPL